VDKGVAALSFFLRQGQVAAAAGVPTIGRAGRGRCSSETNPTRASTPSPPARLPLLRKRLTIAGLAHRTVALRYIGPAAVGLLLAGLWRDDDLVSDGVVCLALSLLCGGLWRGVVGRVRAALQRSFPD
jgi:hypothetical protein